jgi:ribonucleotide monophosphatase NagD (HAD superfamily)
MHHLDRLGVAASEAIVVGDSPYDAQAARKIGLRTIGVLCGGFPEADLRKAGCIAIYRDPADLLRRFDPSVLIRRVAPRRKIYPAILVAGLTVAAVIALVIGRRRD